MPPTESNRASEGPVSTDDHLSYSVSEPDLHGRDLEIVSFLESEELTSFTFDGLRRSLNIHPETLSRSLDRLEEQGIVEKTPEGYRVSGRGREMIGVHPMSSRENPIPLVQTLLPRDVTIEQIISSLKGKWFGGLRWLGYSKNEDATVLKWLTEDGAIRVDAKFSAEALDIEAKLLPGKSVDEAVRAAHQLMSHIAKIYARPYRTRPVSFILFDPNRMLA